MNAEKYHRVKADRAGTRRCTSCLCRFLLSDTNFPHRTEVDRRDEFKSRCHQCTKLTAAKPPTARRIPRGDALREKGPKPCGECGSLPHRVVGPRCSECKATYASEPPPALETFLYRHVERVTA